VFFVLKEGEEMRLIDCTLRDGGYHNSWNFSKKFAEETIQNLVSSGVTDIEVGFRKPKNLQKKSEGIFANLESVNLQSLEISEKAKIGLMINASDYMQDSRVSLDLVKDSFAHSEPAISFVRVAGDIEDIASLKTLKLYLENLGYEVHLNLMKINNLISDFSVTKSADQVLDDIINLNLRYLTLADTYGVMRQNELRILIQKFLQVENIELGLHMHNNLGLAIANSILGLDLGITMLDSTLSGMGRGPGNLRTEFIVGEISYRERVNTYDSSKLLDFTAKTYEPLKEHYKWGESAYYNLGARSLVHPSYIQYLTQRDDYSATEILEAINVLGARNQVYFSEETLSFVLNDQVEPTKFENIQGLGLFAGAESVVILGAGETIRDFGHEDFEALKDDGKELVVSLTLRPFVDRMLIDAYVVLDPVKYFIDYKIVESHQSIIVAPFNLRKDSTITQLSGLFPFTIKSDCLDFNETGAVLPFPSSLGYALMALAASKVPRIKIAGFDGFQEGDPRQTQNQRILDLFEEKFGERHTITFLTPTSYTLKNQLY
jgi:4-hydroxy 2-oxovalerate aldolase